MVEPRTGDNARIALVLGTGGLRGACHVGVLRQLVRRGIPLHAIVGVSAGAVVGAYYAAVGLDVDELIADATTFRGRHLLMQSLNVHLGERFQNRFAAWCGVIPQRLRQLETAAFDRLHHGVRRLGIVCHDLRSRRPHYFATGVERGITLYDAVRASASIPRLFPPLTVRSSSGEELRLTDGGVSDPFPIGFARSPAIDATHVIVVDCRGAGPTPPSDATTIWIRPRIGGGTLWSPPRGLVATVVDGEAAVTGQVLARVGQWLEPALR